MRIISTSVLLVFVLVSCGWSQQNPGQGRGVGAARGRVTAGSPNAVRPAPQTNAARIATPTQSMKGSRGIQSRVDRMQRKTELGSLRAVREQRMETRERSSRADRAPVPAIEASRINPLTQIGVAPGQRALQERLASIERLRDIAIDRGDLQLLERADALESLAREEHGNRFNVNQLGRDAPANALPMDLADRMDLRRNTWGAIDADAKEQPYGQVISGYARELGREWGQFNAEQAQSLGVEFGQLNREKLRPFPTNVFDPIMPPESDIGGESTFGEPSLGEPLTGAVPTTDESSVKETGATGN